MGSGTTNIVANRMNRNSIGIEIMPEYCEMVRQQLEPAELCPFNHSTFFQNEAIKERSRYAIR
jgi:site-specific DNA-methyltransferase (adenine-specific)/site-specific DNA-methyltransferase (cytosine-N4-specific)